MIRSLLDPYLSQTLDQYGATPPLAAKPPGPGLFGTFGRGPGGNALTGLGGPGATLNVNRSDSAPSPGAPNNIGTLPPTPEPSVAFRNALLAGGQAAARAPAYDSVGSSLASALANGLTSGAQSFVATRDAEKDRDYQMKLMAAQRAQSDAAVDQMGLPPGIARVIKSMALPDRQKALAEYMKPAAPEEYAYGNELGTFSKSTGKVATPVAAKEFNVGTGELAQALTALNIAPQAPGKYSPEDALKIKTYLEDQTTRGAAKTFFDLGTQVQKEFPPEIVKRIGLKADNASSAAADLSTIKELESLMAADGGIKTGFAAEARLALGNALVTAGWANDPSVANTQAYKAVAGRRVAEVIKAFGSGTGLSDTDREYATQMAGGKIDVTDAALKRIFWIAKRRGRAIITDANKSAQAAPEEYRGIFLSEDPYAADSTAPTAGTETIDQYLKRVRGGK